jgi:hypothetical protein
MSWRSIFILPHIAQMGNMRPVELAVSDGGMQPCGRNFGNGNQSARCLKI